VQEAIGMASPAKQGAFVHAALFRMVLSILHEALKHGYIPEFASLTHKWLWQYPPWSEPILKSHLDQTQKNLQSTKPDSILDHTKSESAINAFPSSNTPNEHTHYCYASIIEPTGQTYMD